MASSDKPGLSYSEARSLKEDIVSSIPTISTEYIEKLE